MTDSAPTAHTDRATAYLATHQAAYAGLVAALAIDGVASDVSMEDTVAPELRVPTTKPGVSVRAVSPMANNAITGSPTWVVYLWNAFEQEADQEEEFPVGASILRVALTIIALADQD